MKDTSKAQGRKASAHQPAAQTDDLHLFANHFAAALHLARYSDAISPVRYNGMADA